MATCFEKVVLPSGLDREITASLTALEAERGASLKLDAEGTLRGRASTKKAAALNLGVSYLIGKVSDDVLEEGIKYAAGAVASGTATIVARYVGISAGAVFFLTRRGRDVRLPEYTELEVTFSRSVALLPE